MVSLRVARCDVGDGLPVLAFCFFTLGDVEKRPDASPPLPLVRSGDKLKLSHSASTTVCVPVDGVKAPLLDPIVNVSVSF